MMKRVFPIAWFGFLVLFVVGVSVASISRGPQLGDLFFLVVPGVMFIIGYMMFKHFIWVLADEVYDDGDSLIIRNRGDEARIDLAHVMNVSVATYMNPPLITLRLVEPSRFGTEISFAPIHPFSLNPFAKNEIAENLILRVHQARSRRAV